MVVKDIGKGGLAKGNKKPEILEKLAQYELTLLDWLMSIRATESMWQSQENAGLPSRHSLDLYHAM